MKKTIQSKGFIQGLLLIVVLALLSMLIANVSWVKSLSLSALIVGIILGIIFANTVRRFFPQSWDAGINFCTKQILRTGIVLYGFRLTIQDVVAVGWEALMVDLIVVVGTIALALLIGKMLKMDRQTSLLTGVGSAICGAAAVLGAEPVVKAPAHKTAVAVSTVVIFGTLSMFLYPTMYRMGWLSDLTDAQVAIYTGATLHEVAHVVGAGNAMDPSGLLGIANSATVVKMIRVILLAPVLLVLAFIVSKKGNGEKGKITIPWFAILFMVMIALNSLMQTSSIDFSGLNAVIKEISTFMLTMAMTALGVQTTWKKFVQAGVKPFVLAAGLYVWLIAGGYLLVRFI